MQLCWCEKSTDWKKREKELIETLDDLRSSDGSYDCIVPWSGGKDSSYVAYVLKFKYKMNPLLVTFSPLIINEVGEHNRKKLIELGFDNLMIRPNQNISRYLSKDSLRREEILKLIGMLVLVVSQYKLLINIT